MIKKPLFKHFLTLLIIAAVLHISAVFFYFYWTISWFDMVVHFTAGASVALAVILVVGEFYSHISISKREMISITLILVLAVGILWELFELSIGSTTLSDGWLYVLDTGSDLSMDLLGGLIGVFYASYVSKK